MKQSHENPETTRSGGGVASKKSSKTTYHLRPFENDAIQEESFRLSALDFTVPPNYNTYAIVFKEACVSTTHVVETFKTALQRTLRQCRHLVGTIEPNEHGDYSIVRTQDSSVEFVVQHLEIFPSFEQLERHNFTLSSMGNHSVLGVEGMPDSKHAGENPDAIAFQLNIIPGGLIFTTHVHHWALDMTGTTNVIRQVAENCCAAVKATAESCIWNDTFMDRSRFICPTVAPEEKVDSAPRPPRHPDWQPCSWVLFHLPPHKAAELKSIASDGTQSRISTYDAVTALCWRIVARNRAKIYKPDLTMPAIFGQPMDMRSRCDPPMSSRYQGNLLAAGLSFLQSSPLTLSQVISKASFSEISSFIRTITESVGQHNLDESIAKVAPQRCKSDLDMPLDSLPSSSFTTTDWRYARLAHNDFGVAQAVAYRCLYNTTVENMMILYPPHRGSKTGEQGIEVMLPFETQVINLLLEDEDLRKYFEFRGVEVP